MLPIITILDHQELAQLFFGKTDHPNIVNCIKAHLKTFESSTNIKLGVYPFVISELIEIPIIPSTLSLIRKEVFKLNTAEIIKFDTGTTLKKVEIQYNGVAIDVADCLRITLKNTKSICSLYASIDLEKFEDKHEESVRRFCFDEVGKQIDHILSANKKMAKKKTKSKTTFIKR